MYFFRTILNIIYKGFLFKKSEKDGGNGVVGKGSPTGVDFITTLIVIIGIKYGGRSISKYQVRGNICL